MILMPQIFDVTANENARYKRNELEIGLFEKKSVGSRLKTCSFHQWPSLTHARPYGLDMSYVPPVAFTIKMRHTRGLFAKKCITMCADMNI